MMESTSFTLPDNREKLFSTIISLLINLLPKPTATTPTLNQLAILSLVASTPPVGMNFIEDYLDKDNVLWRWWQMNNPTI